MGYQELQVIAYVILGIYILIAMRKKCNAKTIIVSIITIMVCITVFARLFFVIENFQKFLDGIYTIQSALRLKLSNFKIIGVLIGTIIGTIILCKIYKKDAKTIANSVIEAMFLSAGYTKIVCTIVGCCRGKTTNLPWAVSYPQYGIHNIHPTALYEAFVWWISFALLHILKRWIKEDSTRVSIATLFYVVVRMFLLEGLYEGTQFMGSITARIIYCIIILICITIIIVNYLKNRKLKNV